MLWANPKWKMGVFYPLRFNHFKQPRANYITEFCCDLQTKWPTINWLSCLVIKLSFIVHMHSILNIQVAEFTKLNIPFSRLLSINKGFGITSDHSLKLVMLSLIAYLLKIVEINYSSPWDSKSCFSFILKHVHEMTNHLCEYFHLNN